jgi:hypothetical protein
MLLAKRTATGKVIIRDLPSYLESAAEIFSQIKSRGSQERFLWLRPLSLQPHAPL